MADQKPGEHQINIEIDDSVADGNYANISFIAANNSEFVLDFGRYLPGRSKGRIVTRVVMSPIHTKAFLKSLTEAVEKFEKNVGPISPDLANKNIGFRINSDKE
jgi:hypothetical protein